MPDMDANAVLCSVMCGVHSQVHLHVLCSDVLCSVHSFTQARVNSNSDVQCAFTSKGRIATNKQSNHSRPERAQPLVCLLLFLLICPRAFATSSLFGTTPFLALCWRRRSCLCLCLCCFCCCHHHSCASALRLCSCICDSEQLKQNGWCK